MFTRTFTMSLNSDPATGAIPLGTSGAVFSVDLNSPLAFDRTTTTHVEAAVIQAAIWNTSPNVSADFQNNQFTFTTSSAPAGTYTFTFPQGLYSLSGISSFISTQLVNLGLPSGLFQFTGDDATQRVVITFLLAGDSINFSAANSIGSVLGFAAAIIVAPVANYSIYGTNTANLNRNNSYRIRGTLVSGGIQVNAIAGGVIAQVPIDQSPGSQINYQPQNSLWFGAGELIGTGKQSLQFYLENEKGESTPTGGEYWSFAVQFRVTTSIPAK